MRVLAEESRFAGHVGSGHKPQVAGIAKPAVIRNEALAGAEHRFDHRMAPAFDVEAAVVTDVGAAMALACGKRRRGHGDVERRQRLCRRRQLFDLRKRGLAKPVENLELPCQRAVGRGRQVTFQIGQLGGGETHRLRRRLAVDETVVLHQLFGMRVADIDMVAEDIVVLHLQRRDAGRLDILLLQRGDQSPAFIAERTKLVERRVEPGPNEAAVARQKRQLVGKRRRKLGRKRHRRHDHVVKRRKLGKVAEPLRACRDADKVRRRRQRRRQRLQVARAAMAHRQARQCAVDVGLPLHHVAKLAAQIGTVVVPANQLEPPHDRLAFGKRRTDPGRQQPATGCGDGQVDRGQQAAAHLAAKCAGDFQRPARRLVDLHIPGLGNGRGRAKSGHVAFLGQLDIAEQRAGGAGHRTRELAESVKGGNAVIGTKSTVAGNAVEQRRGLLCQAGSERCGTVGERRADRHHELGRRQHGKQAFEPLRRHFLNREITCRHVGPGQRHRLARAPERGKEIMRARRQQIILGQGAGSQDPDHLATKRALATTLFLCRRVLDLLANGDAVTGADQTRQITVNRMYRHAAHRNVVAIALAALGQRNAKRRRADLRILEEHLVKIAHAIEQQRVGVRFFDPQILRDHRRRRLYFCRAWC